MSDKLYDKLVKLPGVLDVELRDFDSAGNPKPIDGILFIFNDGTLVDIAAENGELRITFGRSALTEYKTD